MDEDDRLFIITIKEIKEDTFIGIVDEGDLDIPVEFRFSKSIINPEYLIVGKKLQWTCRIDKETTAEDWEPIEEMSPVESQVLIDNLLEFTKNADIFRGDKK